MKILRVFHFFSVHVSTFARFPLSSGNFSELMGFWDKIFIKTLVINGNLRRWENIVLKMSSKHAKTLKISTVIVKLFWISNNESWWNHVKSEKLFERWRKYVRLMKISTKIAFQARNQRRRLRIWRFHRHMSASETTMKEMFTKRKFEFSTVIR